MHIAHEDRGDLCAGRAALRVEINRAVQLRAVDELFGVRPAHGLEGVGADPGLVGIGHGERALRHGQPLEDGVAVEDRCHLLAGDAAVGIKQVAADAVDDLVFRCPDDCVGVPCTRRHIAERIFRRGLRLTLEPVEHRHEHRAGHFAVRLKGRVGRAVEQAGLENEVDADMRPVGAFGDVDIGAARAALAALAEGEHRKDGFLPLVADRAGLDELAGRGQGRRSGDDSHIPRVAERADGRVGVGIVAMLAGVGRVAQLGAGRGGDDGRQLVLGHGNGHGVRRAAGAGVGHFALGGAGGFPCDRAFVKGVADGRGVVRLVAFLADRAFIERVARLGVGRRDDGRAPFVAALDDGVEVGASAVGAGVDGVARARAGRVDDRLGVCAVEPLAADRAEGVVQPVLADYAGAGRADMELPLGVEHGVLRDRLREVKRLRERLVGVPAHKVVAGRRRRIGLRLAADGKRGEAVFHAGQIGHEPDRHAEAGIAAVLRGVERPRAHPAAGIPGNVVVESGEQRVALHGALAQERAVQRGFVHVTLHRKAVLNKVVFYRVPLAGEIIHRSKAADIGSRVLDRRCAELHGKIAVAHGERAAPACGAAADTADRDRAARHAGLDACDRVAVFDAAAPGIAGQTAGVMRESVAAVQIDAADKAAVLQRSHVQIADQSADGVRAANSRGIGHCAEEQKVAHRALAHIAEQTDLGDGAGISLRAGKHSGDFVQPAVKGTLEDEVNGAAGGARKIADRDPEMAAQVNVRRERDGAALEGAAAFDLLRQRREIGCVINDPVARLGGIECGVVVALVRPEGGELRLLCGQNRAADGAVLALRQKLGLGVGDGDVAEGSASFKGGLLLCALGAFAAAGAGLVIDGCMVAVGLGSEVFFPDDLGGEIVICACAVFGAAVLADGLMVAVGYAAVAGLGFRVGGIAGADAGVRAVAVGRPRAPVVPERLAVRKGGLGFRTLGAFAAAGAGLVIDGCMVAVGLGFQILCIGDLGGVAVV